MILHLSLKHLSYIYLPLPKKSQYAILSYIPPTVNSQKSSTMFYKLFIDFANENIKIYDPTIIYKYLLCDKKK